MVPGDVGVRSEHEVLGQDLLCRGFPVPSVVDRSGELVDERLGLDLSDGETRLASLGQGVSRLPSSGVDQRNEGNRHKRQEDLHSDEMFDAGLV